MERIWYDVVPLASDLWVLEGPQGGSRLLRTWAREKGFDAIPEGYRWVTDEEWEREHDKRTIVAID